MTDFPEPPSWVPRPFPEVPADYKPRKGDLVQHMDGRMSIMGAEQIASIGATNHRVLALANPLPKTRKFTIEDTVGEIVFEGEEALPHHDGNVIVQPVNSYFHVSDGRNLTGEDEILLRLDRPFRIERKEADQ